MPPPTKNSAILYSIVLEHGCKCMQTATATLYHKPITTSDASSKKKSTKVFLEDPGKDPVRNTLAILIPKVFVLLLTATVIPQ